MRPVALAVLVGLGGCATTQPVATVAPICGSMRTVYISKDDVLTEQTASQIEANNIARAELCGRSPAPRKSKGVPTS